MLHISNFLLGHSCVTESRHFGQNCYRFTSLPSSKQKYKRDPLICYLQLNNAEACKSFVRFIR